MSYDHLYKPEPCSAWPAQALRAVSIAYRDAAGLGLDGPPCLDQVVSAYRAAGGAQHGAERTVRNMIASLPREQGDWLWGPCPGLARSAAGSGAGALGRAILFGPGGAVGMTGWGTAPARDHLG